MKYLLFICVALLGLAVHAQAQSADTANNPYAAPAATATAKLKAKYDLSEVQAAKMQQAQERKLRQLNQIEVLKTTDLTQYYAKLKGIQQGTLGSIKHLLVSKTQLDLFQQTQAKIREEQAEKRAVLAQSTKTAQESEAEIIAIYAE